MFRSWNFLQHGQDAGHRRRAHVTEQQEDLVVQHEGHGVVDGGVRLIAVVIGLDGDAAAANAALFVDVLEIGAGAPGIGSIPSPRDGPENAADMPSVISVSVTPEPAGAPRAAPARLPPIP